MYISPIYTSETGSFPSFTDVFHFNIVSTYLCLVIRGPHKHKDKIKCENADIYHSQNGTDGYKTIRYPQELINTTQIYIVKRIPEYLYSSICSVIYLLVDAVLSLRYLK